MIEGTAVYHTPKGDIEKVHLVADAGKVLTHDGESFWNCIDVDDANGWYEVDAPVPEDGEATIEDYEAALAELGVK